MSFSAIKIGKHKIEDPIVLAPMAGVTDRPFRQLCKSLGAGLAVSEMVGANSLMHGSEKTKRRANHEGETSPRSVQIVGADPEKLAFAAKYNADNGADIIDINMGCPAKKICNTLSGSALMKDEPLVQKILSAVVKAVDIPVTLKIRTGWDKDSKNGVTIAKIAQDSGIMALAVHGRTRCCMFKGDAEYDTIAEIKQAINIPLFANGDIKDGPKALEVLRKTGADGIMIGRAAQGKPWIFRQIVEYLRKGTITPDPDIAQIKEWMLGHLNNLYQFYGEHRGVLIARKHVSWYSKGQRGGNAFRQEFNKLLSAEQQLESAENFFAELIELYQ
jgi:tRNA-dihydrouridine synthase B